MWSRFLGLSTAAAATLIVVGIGAAVVGPLIYFLLVFSEGLVEGVGIITSGWGAAHTAVFLWTAGILIAAAALWLGQAYFRRAFEVEMDLRRGGAPPAT